MLTFKAREPSLTAAIAAAPEPATTTASASSASPSSTKTATRKTTTALTKTITGNAIPTQYGSVQVRVTIKNGRITAVTPLQLTGNDPKSVQISSQAEPQLLQSALTKQSAAIDAVSGATVTSAGYEASLQSALDKAGFKAANGARGSSTVPQVEEHGGGGPGGPSFGP